MSVEQIFVDSSLYENMQTVLVTFHELSRAYVGPCFNSLAWSYSLQSTLMVQTVDYGAL